MLSSRRRLKNQILRVAEREGLLLGLSCDDLIGAISAPTPITRQIYSDVDVTDFLKTFCDGFVSIRFEEAGQVVSVYFDSGKGTHRELMVTDAHVAKPHVTEIAFCDFNHRKL